MANYDKNRQAKWRQTQANTNTTYTINPPRNEESKYQINWFEATGQTPRNPFKKPTQ